MSAMNLNTSSGSPGTRAARAWPQFRWRIRQVECGSTSLLLLQEAVRTALGASGTRRPWELKHLRKTFMCIGFNVQDGVGRLDVRPVGATRYSAAADLEFDFSAATLQRLAPNILFR